MVMISKLGSFLLQVAKKVKEAGKKTPVKPKKAAEVKAKKVSKKTTADAGSSKKKSTKK